jgi:hypothetical protein
MYTVLFTNESLLPTDNRNKVYAVISNGLKMVEYNVLLWHSVALQ